MVEKFKNIVIETNHPLALSSNDYLHPLGARKDDSRNERFNHKLYRLFPWNRQICILDLGCAKGGFVIDCLNHGHLAVGLEGSDYSRMTHHFGWHILADKLLFNADIAKPFKLLKSVNDEKLPLQFDVITAWEIMEHVREIDLEAVCKNIKEHLKENGLIFMSISNHEDIENGVRYHHCLHEKEWWIRKFEELQLYYFPALVKYFNNQYIRGPKQDKRKDSFNVILTNNKAFDFPILKLSVFERLIDYWSGSLPQRILRRFVNGY